MAKKIKFALKMKDGAEARSLQELQENFDLNLATAYFLDGRLESWLEDRYYDEQLEQVRELEKEDPHLQEKLCQIFGIEYTEESMSVEAIAIRERRISRLREITEDEEILSHVDQVAFSQLLDHSIDQKLVTQLMGHTNIACTENFYHKDRKSTEQKFNIISGIPEFMAK